MNVHKNARLTPFGRERVVKQVLERVLTPAAASAAAGVSLRTIYKWLSRFRAEGVAGLGDRRSRPKRLRCSLSARQRERIAQLRRERRPYREIAKLVRAPLSSATSTTSPASSYTWTSSACRASGAPDTVLPALAVISRRARDTSSCTWRSTTTLELPTASSFATSAVQAAGASLRAWLAITGAWVSESLESSLTTVPAIAPSGFAAPAGAWASSIHSRALIAHKPTARPSASSRPCSENGRTCAVTLITESAPRHGCLGYTATTGTDLTPV